MPVQTWRHAVPVQTGRHTLPSERQRRINFIHSDEVSTLSIAKPISRTGRSGGLQLLAALPIHGTGAPLSLGHRQRP